MRIATFNVQNLRARRRDGAWRFDGARDGDAAEPGGAAGAALDAADRALTADLIAAAGADVLALQEVFDQDSLDRFHASHLAPRGAAYPHRVCREGNDGRSEDVALLSRAPLAAVVSHAGLTFADLDLAPPPGRQATARLFRRDCLAVQVGGLWLFVVHFKANHTGDPVAEAVRRAEALAVRRIIEGRFARPAAAPWLILGDLNTHRGRPADDAAVGRLLDGFAVDLLDRRPADDRWTYVQAETDFRSGPDGLLASPALAAAQPHAVVRIWRQGLPARADDRGERLPGVGWPRPRASDHALVSVDLDWKQ